MHLSDITDSYITAVWVLDPEYIYCKEAIGEFHYTLHNFGRAQSTIHMHTLEK
jgi:hypothetical protein